MRTVLALLLHAAGTGMTVLALRTYKGRNGLWAQHKGTGGDPSAWSDRKASILNVTPPSNVF